MRKELKNILVPVDFKEPSIKAVKFAGNLAERLDSEVVLLNVLETPGLLHEFFSPGDKLEKITNRAKEQLSALSDTLREEHPGLTVITRVERGKPYNKIIEIAEDVKTRMIILGENHQEPTQELGTTIYHVTLRSAVPVLTLKGETEGMNNSIVVPLDLTRQTRKQLFSALVYGLNYNAKIHLISVVVGGIKVRESRIFKKLKRAKQTLEENGVQCTTKLFKRSEVLPYRRVLEYAGNIDAGMILVLTHEEGYTHDNYIGAFAHHIINESKVPVLSLTATAASDNSESYLKHFVDPIGMLKK